MIDHWRRSKEDAWRPELYSLGKNCISIRVLSLTQVRLKPGYLARVPLWVQVLLWSAACCGVYGQGNEKQGEPGSEKGWAKGLDQQVASNWPFITVLMKMRSSVQRLAAEELASGYLALTSFTTTVICWQDASVCGGMYVNELALSDSVVAVSGHITPQWLQGNSLLGSELSI